MPAATPRLTTTSYVLLASLATRDCSAYELAEQAALGLTDLWFGETRQRYQAPKRLVELGLATSRTEPADGTRTRTVYSITPDGRRALADWLALDTRPLSIRFEGMVRVIAADYGTIDDLRRTLAQVEAQALEAYDRNAAFAARLLATGGMRPERLHTVALPLRFLSQHFGAVLDWVEWAQAEVATWADTVTPGERHADRLRAALEEVVADHEARQARRAT